MTSHIKIRKSGNFKKTDIFASRESNVQSYARAFPNTFDKAVGSKIWDANGRSYLDFLSGAGSLNYGHNNPVFKKALVSYIMDDGITHSLDLHTSAKERFLQAFEDIILTPRNLDYVVQFTGPTGTNAVEAAFKLARKVTGRSNIISFTNGFHGVTLGALAATGNQHFRQGAGQPLQNVTAIPYDNYFGEGVDTMAMFERQLDDPSSGMDLPAAVIVETVQGEGGLNAARVSWLQKLQAICQERDIILIVDDIQAGCGRTGSFFSFEEAGLQPDIVTMSKSISGFGLPMAIVLINRSMDIWKPAEHNGTFRGNNHAFITATAALETYWADPEFEPAIMAKGEYITARLQAMVDSFGDDIEQVCGRGMMMGIRCTDPKKAAEITARAYELGLIIERAGSYDEVVKCFMPLTITDADLKEGMDILAQAVADIFGENSQA